jgi:hypothetical protein
MRTVADQAGRRYLLLKQSRDAWLVRDPETGEERHRPEATLRVVGDESPLETAARSVPERIRQDLPLQSERRIGLIAEIRRREPVGVRTILADYDLCESDLHGLLGEFRAAGLVVETRVGGERGYETSDDLQTRWPDD